MNNTGSSLYYQAGLEGTKKLDSAGSEWENDIFYSYSRNSTDQDFDAEYIFPVSFFTGGDGTGINHRHRLNLKKRYPFENEKKIYP